MELREFLVWFSGVGSVLAVSWLIEFFGLFESMKPKTKQMVFVVICVVVGVGAKLVLDFVPMETIELVAPYFAIVAAIFSYIFLGTEFHDKTKTE